MFIVLSIALLGAIGSFFFMNPPSSSSLFSRPKVIEYITQSNTNSNARDGRVAVSEEIDPLEFHLVVTVGPRPQAGRHITTSILSILLSDLAPTSLTLLFTNHRKNVMGLDSGVLGTPRPDESQSFNNSDSCSQPPKPPPRDIPKSLLRLLQAASDAKHVERSLNSLPPSMAQGPMSSYVAAAKIRPRGEPRTQNPSGTKDASQGQKRRGFSVEFLPDHINPSHFVSMYLYAMQVPAVQEDPELPLMIVEDDTILDPNGRLYLQRALLAARVDRMRKTASKKKNFSISFTKSTFSWFEPNECTMVNFYEPSALPMDPFGTANNYDKVVKSSSKAAIERDFSSSHFSSKIASSSSLSQNIAGNNLNAGNISNVTKNACTIYANRKDGNDLSIIKSSSCISSSSIPSSSIPSSSSSSPFSNSSSDVPPFEFFLDFEAKPYLEGHWLWGAQALMFTPELRRRLINFANGMADGRGILSYVGLQDMFVFSFMFSRFACAPYPYTPGESRICHDVSKEVAKGGAPFTKSDHVCCSHTDAVNPEVQELGKGCRILTVPSGSNHIGASSGIHGLKQKRFHLDANSFVERTERGRRRWRAQTRKGREGANEGDRSDDKAAAVKEAIDGVFFEGLLPTRDLEKSW
eukprot:CAMPEP_0175071806 /NCGR_PEP_ID=MMETSP0052_2-20121109/19471_1 /TAXON_ID=51329 ORGANISM="Polytomella parva, Strain SAG 63-3" /NCGR_SAMPLE_ID=MMETSP0052_2 /ASSEMBLY_ACC=CAM_ASM_000194 /LENGTH=635 /DNA_ID=CAMNT_0016339065 /DNA_START=733 /DNA_END=2640 /DNA_ORIENTATION=-